MSAADPGDIPKYRYGAALADDIEARWQAWWEQNATFAAPNPVGPLAGSTVAGAIVGRPKLFVMDMFPYPSGTGLHVGHPLGYIATDVYARFKRMTGYNVLHTMGYDAYGLPAEQHAMSTGEHPRINTELNVATMRRQLRRLGLGHDQRRSVSTTDIEFLEFTQRIFLRIFNSWYDPQATNPLGGPGAARPISELIARYEVGTTLPDDGRSWATLSPTVRRAIVDGHRLAYVANAPVNWCPGLGTIVANEEVTPDGRSDIGNFPVFKRAMRQWVMRITTYADRLIEDLDLVDWPEPVKMMQRNWIGRSSGARVRFDVGDDGAKAIEVFTTRPDTLFGATYMVLAPEHSLVDGLTAERWPIGVDPRWTEGHDSPTGAVRAYRQQSAAKSDIVRQDEGREKTGVFLGSFATNPVNGEQIPLFIADYVLMGYGTGAIMAVPSGDQRDFEFAQAYGLPIRATVLPPAAWFEANGLSADAPPVEWPHAYDVDGTVVNSANAAIDLNGMSIADAKAAMNDWLETSGHGRGTVQYKLRDWLFSRQRYWGEPFPIVYDETGMPIALPEAMLPVALPDTDQFAPRTFEPDDDQSNPEAPLDRLTDWVNVTLDLGDGPNVYRRDTNVMPQWAGSCSYYLRYIDPALVESITVDENEQYWMGDRGVDLYVGGVEHAVLHLLYSRFWHKVLYDLGVVSTPEPFARLFNQGYIQAHYYEDGRGTRVDATMVEERDGQWFYEGQPVTRFFGKMGKSLKNVVTPDDMYDAYGADTLRLYEMSMGPLELSRPWETRAVSGAYRLLQRVWRNIVDEDTGDARVTEEAATDEDRRRIARTVDGVRGAMDALRFNTPIAKITELNNHLTQAYPGGIPRATAEPLVLLLAPFAPHMAEELWAKLGHSDSLAWHAFPEADPALLVDDTVEVPVQVNGKLRAKVTVAAGLSADALEAAVRAEPKVAELLAGKGVRKVIAVAGRLVNFVVA